MSVLAATLGPLACSSRSTRPPIRKHNLNVGKMPLGKFQILKIATWEIVIFEIVVWKLPMGKCHCENTWHRVYCVLYKNGANMNWEDLRLNDLLASVFHTLELIYFIVNTIYLYSSCNVHALVFLTELDKAQQCSCLSGFVKIQQPEVGLLKDVVWHRKSRQLK